MLSDIFRNNPTPSPFSARTHFQRSLVAQQHKCSILAFIPGEIWQRSGWKAHKMLPDLQSSTLCYLACTVEYMSLVHRVTCSGALCCNLPSFISMHVKNPLHTNASSSGQVVEIGSTTQCANVSSQPGTKIFAPVVSNTQLCRMHIAE